MNIYRTSFIGLLFTAMLSLSGNNAWASVDSDVQTLQQRWAEVNYKLKDDAQMKAYEALVSEAENIAAAHPDAAEVWVWSGIIKSSYAGAKGGLGALSLAKASKKELEKAIALNGNALDGSAYTSLGTLYFKVPGWPLGFGNDDKARELLQKALAINPEGIDTNYFYAEFLRDQGDYRAAADYYQKAMNAAPRPNRPLADSGRKAEIETALAEVRKKLKE